MVPNTSGSTIEPDTTDKGDDTTPTTEDDPDPLPTPVVAPTDAPVPSTPFNGATDVTLPVQFSWSAVAKASKYEIYAFKTTVWQGVSTTQVFVDVGSSRGSLGGVTSGQTPTGNYFASNSNYPASWNGSTITWRVRARNNGGDGPWSASYQFTLKD